MMTSGLVLTLAPDPAQAARARQKLAERPGITAGQLQGRWLPVVAELPDTRAGRDLHEWLNTVSGIEFVDVIEVGFDDAEMKHTSLEESTSV